MSLNYILLYSCWLFKALLWLTYCTQSTMIFQLSMYVFHLPTYGAFITHSPSFSSSHPILESFILRFQHVKLPGAPQRLLATSGLPFRNISSIPQRKRHSTSRSFLRILNSHCLSIHPQAVWMETYIKPPDSMRGIQITYTVFDYGNVQSQVHITHSNFTCALFIKLVTFQGNWTSSSLKFGKETIPHIFLSKT